MKIKAFVVVLVAMLVSLAARSQTPCENLPTGVSCSLTGWNSATNTYGANVTWSAPYPGRRQYLLCNDTGYAVQGGSHNLGDLRPGTVYTLQVIDSADVFTDGCRSNAIAFRTPGRDTTDAPVVERFNMVGSGLGVIPPHWHRIANFDDEQRRPHIVNTYSHSDTVSMLLSAGHNETQSHYAILTTPYVDEEISTLFVRFHMMVPVAGAVIEVGVCDTFDLVNNHFTPIDTIEPRSIGSWEEYMLSLANYTGNGHYVALRMHRSLQSANDLYVFVDDFILEHCGVSSVRVYDRSHNSFWIDWTTYGAPQQTDVEVGPVGFVPGTGIYLSNITHPYRIGGLSQATTYEFRVLPHCTGSRPAERYRQTTGTTLTATPLVLNMCEGFEETSSGLPDGWRTITDDNSWFSWVTTDRSYEGSRSLYIHPYHSARRYLILPPVDSRVTDLSDLSITFRAQGPTMSARYIWGVMDSPENINTFVPIDTAFTYAEAIWQTLSASLDGYNGPGEYITLFLLEGNAYEYYYVDNLQISPCLVTNFGVTNIRSTQVELRWDTVTDLFHGDRVRVVYGPVGSTDSDTIDLDVRGAIQTIAGRQRLIVTGLTPATVYRFSIVGLCGTPNQCTLTSVTARTSSADINVPYCEDFEAYSSYPPDYFSPSVYNGTPTVVNNNNLGTGPRALKLSSYGYTYELHGTAVLPMLPVDDWSQVTMSFDAYTRWSGDYVMVGVVEYPQDETTFVPIDTIHLTAYQKNKYAVDFSSYHGIGQYIALKYYVIGTDYYTSNDVYIDNIIVDHAQTLNVWHNYVGTQRVTIHWDSLGSAYEGAVVEIGRQGFTFGSGTRSAVTHGGVLVIDTLQADVEYEYYVLPVSGGVPATCSFDRHAFRTLDESVHAPYCNGFENYGTGLSYTWTVVPTPNRPGLSGDYRYNGNRSLHFWGTGALSMPPIENDSTDGLMLRFMLFGRPNYGSSTMRVGISTDPNDTNTFVQLAQFAAPIGEWQECVVDLSAYQGTGLYITFINRGQGRTYIDNIRVDRCSPGIARIYNVSASQATIQWTLTGTADSVEIEYGIAGFAEGTGTILHILPSQYAVPGADPSVGRYTISGLALGTTYNLYLRPYCTGSLTACNPDVYTFTTNSRVLANGYCEDFTVSYYDKMPACWNVLQKFTVSGYNTYDYPYAHRFESLSDSVKYTSSIYSLDFYTTSTGANIAVLNASEVPVNQLIASFQLRADEQQHPEAAMMIVGVLDDPADKNTFVPVDTIVPSYSFRRYDVDFSSYTGEGRHIGLWYQCPTTAIHSYLDDFALHACHPANVQVHDVTDHSLRLSWIMLGNSDTTRIIIQPGDRHIATRSLQYTVTGLSPATRYTFYLYGKCQDTTLSCQAAAVSAYTLHQSMEAPICFDFESDWRYYPPKGWAAMTDFVSHAPANNYYPHIDIDNGNRVIQLRSDRQNATSDYASVAVMPALASGNIQDHFVDFWWKGESAAAMLIVGVMNGDSNMATFVPVDTLWGDGSWQHPTVSFAATASTGHNIAFRLEAVPPNNVSALIDNVVVRTCRLTQWRAYHPSVTTIDLGGAATAGCSAVHVEYHEGDADFAPGTGTSMTIPTTISTLTGLPVFSTTLTNLDTATWYSFHFYPICSPGSDDCNYEVARCRTLSPSVALPYCINFESDADGTYPDNWRLYGSSSVSNHLLQASAATTPTFLIAPPVDIPAACATIDSLYFNLFLHAATPGTILVGGTMTDVTDAATFVSSGDTVRLNAATIVDTAVVLAVRNLNTATQMAALSVVSPNGAPVAIEIGNICLEECEALRVRIADITQNSVNIYWDHYGDNALLCEYGPQGFTPGSGTPLSLNASPATVSGLTPGADYDFYFLSDCPCGIEGAAYASPITGGLHGDMPLLIPVRTQSPDLEAPYCEHFNDPVGQLPPYWRLYSSQPASSSAAISDQNYAHEAIGTRQCLPLQSCDPRQSLELHAAPDQTVCLSLPPLHPGSVGVTSVSFLTCTTTPQALLNGWLQVGIMTDPDLPSSFTAVHTVLLDSLCHWQQQSVSLASYSGTGRYIAFRLAAASSNCQFFVDNLHVSQDPADPGCAFRPDDYTTAMSLPYCEDFEHLPVDVGALPEIWTLLQPAGNRPGNPQVTFSNGQNGVLFQVTSSTPNFVALPPLRDGATLADKWVNIEMYSPNPSRAKLDLGYLADPDNLASFVSMASLPVGSGNPSNVYNVQLRDVQQAHPDRLVIRASTTSGNYQILLYDISISAYPTPTNVTVSCRNHTDYEVRWNATEGMGLYTLSYGYGDHWNTLPTDSCYVRLSHLEPLTTYQFYFITPLGEHLCHSFSFTTGPLQSLPYCESFTDCSGTTFPTGWSTPATYYGHPYIHSAHYIEFYYNSTQIAVLPDFDMIDVHQVGLSFSMMASSNYDRQVVVAGVMTHRDDISTFVPVDTLRLSANGQWERKTVDFSSYSGNGSVIALSFVAQNNYYLYLDDITVTACPIPRIAAYSAHSLALVYPGSSGGGVDYFAEHGSGLFAPGSGDTLYHITSSNSTTQQPTSQNNSTNQQLNKSTFLIDGLLPESEHNFNLYCDTNQPNPTCFHRLKGRTPPLASLPACWQLGNTSVLPPEIYSYCSNTSSYYFRIDGYAYGGARSLRMDLYSYELGYIALPDLDIDSLKHAHISISTQRTTNSVCGIVVGVMVDRDDYSTFQPVDTIVCSQRNTWQSFHIPLASYAGNGRFVAFRHYAPGPYGNGQVFLKDIYVQDFPFPRLGLVDSNKALVTFDSTILAAYRPSPYGTLLYGPSGFTPGDAQSHYLPVNTDSMVIGNLQPNVAYDFYAYSSATLSLCSGCTTSVCIPSRLMTTSHLQPLPYCDNFSSYGSGGYVLPTGWLRYNSPDWSSLTSGTTYPRIESSSSQYSLVFNKNSEPFDYCVLPPFDATNIAQISISFDMRPVSGYDTTSLVVGAIFNTADPDSFIPIDTVATNSAGWKHYTVNLRKLITALAARADSRPPGDYRFIALWHDDSHPLEVRNLVVTSCPQPDVKLVGWGTALFQLPPTETDADYWIEYKAGNFLSGDPEASWVNALGNNFSLNLPLPNTTYFFYIHCSQGDAVCSQPLSVTTTMAMGATYCQDFPTAGSLPPGWRSFNTWNNGTPVVDGSERLYFLTRRYEHADAILPEAVVAPVSDLHIYFDMQVTNTDYAIMALGVMSDPDDVSSYVGVDTIHAPNTSSNSYHVSFQHYQGSGTFPVFRFYTPYTYNTQFQAYLDNIRVEHCHIPQGLRVNLCDHNKIRVSADEPTTTGFYIRYGLAGSDRAAFTALHCDTLPMIIEVANSSTYEVYFTCDADGSSCLEPLQIHTLSAPTSLPWCQTFEGGTSTVELIIGSDGVVDSTPTLAEWGVASGRSAGSHSLRLSAPAGSAVTAVLPSVTATSADDILLSLWSNRIEGDGVLQMGLMGDPCNPDSFLPFAAIPDTAALPLRAAPYDCDHCWYASLIECDTCYSSGLPGWYRFVSDLSDAITPSGSCAQPPIVAVRCKAGSAATTFLLDEVLISPCGIYGAALVDLEPDRAVVVWHGVGNPTINVVAIDNTTHASLDPSRLVIQGDSLFILGLSPLHDYSLSITSSCSALAPCGADYQASLAFTTPQGRDVCIDATDLMNPNVQCRWGTYSKPWAHQTIVDYGSASPESRHTIHHDTTERDPRTGNLLRTVPQGSLSSVRLGNWGFRPHPALPQAESITYAFTVDTLAFDLLQLKYAAVLQDPMHEAVDQPRFRLEILNQNGTPIGGECAQADFIASQQLGWNSAPNWVLWKDWTTVGIDLSPYAGQHIIVRLTSFDCNEGEHFGYAYFSLDCSRKNIYAEACGQTDSNTFTAPDGFDYRWYTSDNAATLSRQQSIRVASSENRTYICRCGFLDDTNCSFSLFAYAGDRFPLASFTYTTQLVDCQFHVNFTNTSTITSDGVTPLPTNEPCETAEWDFGNGMVSTQYHASAVFADTGTYEVSLVVFIGDGQCSDTIVVPIHLVLPPTAPSISGDHVACLGDSILLTLDGGTSPLWFDGSTGNSVFFAVDSAAWYQCHFRNANGCPDSLKHFVDIVAPVHTSDTLALVLAALPTMVGDSMITAALFAHDDTISFETTYRMPGGCDSVVTYLVTTISAFRTSIDTALCSDLLPFVWINNTVSSVGTGTYTFIDTLASAIGADSIVTLHLTVHAATAGDTTAVACDSFTWWGSHYTNSTNSATHVYTNAAGCDSVVTLHLTINASNTGDTAVVACDSFTWWNTNYTNSTNTATYVYTNAAGCDSVVTLHLTINASTAGDTTAVACDSFTWWNTNFTNSTNTVTHVYSNAAGCDSVVTLHLTINASTAGDTTAVACDSFSWWNTNFTNNTNSATHVYSNVAGCDSVVTLHLTINASTSGDTTVTACDSYSWIDGNTYAASTTTPTYTFTGGNAVGCDSTVTLHLTINASNTGDTTAVACDSFTWWNSHYTNSTNTATHVYTNAAGCDSVVTLHLTINASTTGDTSAVACDSFTWWNTNFTNSTNTVTHVYSNAAGCDSVVTLHLTINASTAGDTTAVACDSFTWWNTNYTNSTNSATHVFTNAVGCDSVVTLHLTINASNTGDTTVTACDSFTWWNTNFTNSTNSATHVFTNTLGCDSVVTLHLTINASSTGDTTVVACDSFTWWNMNFTNSTNSATHVYANALGCDSLVTLHLTVNHSTSGTDVQTACDSYTWIDGNTYTSSTTTPTHTIVNGNADGCDSTVTLNLTVNYSNSGVEDTTVCNSFVWHGTEYTASTTTATYTTTNSVGCDSVTTLHLTVNPCSSTTLTVCDSYTWKGSVYTTSGVYTDGIDTLKLTVHYSSTGDTSVVACDSFTWWGSHYTNSTNSATHVYSNAVGCDSVVTLHLTINASSTGDTTVTACDSFTWWNTNYTNSTNSATHVYTNAVGCDSVVTLHLTINASNTGDTTAVACDSFTWWNTNFTNSTNSATHVYSNVAGCDSVVTLHLTINASSTGDTTVTACDSFTWWNSNFTNSTNTAKHVFTNAAGCDSLVTLHLTINASNTGDTTAVACDSFTWWNTNFTNSTNTATHVYSNVAGCDSVVTLHLTINASSTGDTTVTACDSFTWWNTNYTNNTNSATHVFANAAGCDSVVTLHLTINASNTGDTTVVACDSFTWWNTNYTNSTNSATHVFTNAAGCDSVVTLHLTINASSTGDTTVTACDSFTWWGSHYTNSTNSATHVFTNALGCDSVVTLHLTINASNTGDTTVVACDSFTWWNTNYTNSTNSATHVYSNVAGCDSVVTLHLTINASTSGDTTVTACDSYTWIDGNTYTSSTTTPTHTIVNGNADGCDSTVTLNLTVNYSNSGVEDTTVCNSFVWHGTEYTASTTTATYTTTNSVGCDSVTTLHLTVNPCSSTTLTVCDSYTWKGAVYTTSGVYTDGIDTLKLTVHYSSTGDTTVVACDSFTWIDGNSYTSTTATPTYTYNDGNADGCDSTVTLHLTIKASTTGDTSVEACVSFTWWNTNYTNSTNSATHVFTNAAGCDSVVTLHLTINASNTGDTTVTACDSFTWWNTNYTNSTNSATHVYANALGCDSVVTLHLTINASTAGDTTVTACDSFTWWNTNYTNSTNTATHVYTNAAGCDSLVTLHLTVNHSTSGTDVQTACDSYTWIDGITYTSSTSTPTHTIVNGNAYGCDSTVTLNLTVNYSNSGVEDTTVCNSFVWHGTEYTSSTTTATYTTTNSVGCDSVTTLHLTVNPCSSTTLTVCDSYTWKGFVYTTSGVYTDGIDTLKLTVHYSSTGDTTVVACDSFTWIDGNSYTSTTATPTYTYNDGNADGCDSTVTLHLTIKASSTGDTSVVACDSFAWWNTNYTNSTNSATHVFTNALGCDSVVTLHLTINTSSTGDTTVTACDSFTWWNTNYTNSTNTATHVFTNAAGCDSVVTLHLTINASNTGDTTVVACDSFTWWNTNYTNSTNTATHVYTNAAGCDSLVTLHLTVNHSTSGTDVQTACDSYTWIDGNTYTSSTSTPTHTFVNGNADGCDSTVTLNLTVNYSNSGVEDTTVCNSFVWHGTEYTASTTTATYTTTNSVGCDSVTTLHLTVNPCSSTTLTVCDSYTWKGSVYTTSGVYTDGIDTLKLTVHYSSTGDTTVVACDSFTWWNSHYTNSTNSATHVYSNAVGCDSVVTLHLTIKSSSTGDTSVVACDGFSWWNTNYTNSTNSATHVFANAVGCDSVVTLHLTINASSTGDTTVTACDSFTWWNTNYTNSTNSATHVYANALGCDSVVTLHLTVNHSTFGMDVRTACDSYTWLDGNTYTTSVTTPTYTIVNGNADGCDSTVTLQLTINASTTGDTSVVACDSFSWWGSHYSNSTNSATHVYTNAAGCDSLVTLHLTINASTTGDTSAVACDSFTWWGSHYTNSTNSATHVYTNAAGCDSLVTLHLTINASTTGDTSAVACDSFSWWNTNYTNSTNSATHVFANAAGCDSVVTLHLTINPSTSGDTTAVACESFSWWGSHYTNSTNTATHLYTNAAGCDSLVTLHLTINTSTAGDTTAVACDSFTWWGSHYTNNTNSATHIYANAAGCDSVVTLHLTINHSTSGTDVQTACDSYSWIDGNTYTASTTTPTYTIVGGSAAGCDSVVTLNLTINASSTGDTSATACDSFTWWDNTYTTSTDNATYVFTNAAGCDSTVTLHLTVVHSASGDTTVYACDSFTWNDITYTESTTDVFQTFTQDGCDSSVTLHLTINHSSSGILDTSACNMFVWHGMYFYNSTDSATYTTTNLAGCDSLISLHLTINPCQSFSMTVCDSLLLNGIVRTHSGIYNYGNGDTLFLTVVHSSSGDTSATACDSFTWWNTNYTYSTNSATHVYTNAAGCDSVVTLHLTINNSSVGDTTVVACDSFTWWNTNYTNSTNSATHLFTNAAGCDSVVTLHLTINNSSSGDTAATACDSFTWWNTNYTNSTNSATHLFSNAAGCDSTVTLHLTVNYSTSGDTAATACDSFTWWNTNYTNSTNSATHLFTNAAGCDSVVTLHLTINTYSVGDTSVTACDSFYWWGTTYTADGTPTYQFSNAAGCDSVVTLHLTLNHSNSAIVDTTACNSFVWHGVEYTESTTSPTFTTTNAAGCDSLTTLHLTVVYCSSTTISVCDSFFWKGSLYTSSGVYTDGADTLYLTVNHASVGIDSVASCDSFTWIDGITYSASIQSPSLLLQNAAGCDSVVTLHLTVNTPSSGDTSATACDSFAWHGTTYTAGGTPTYQTTNAAGCDSVVTLHLTINHSTTGDTSATACDSFSWHGTTYTAGGTPTYQTTNAAACDSTVTLHLTINYSTTGDTSATVCDSFTWHGTTYTAGGTPTYQTTNAAACDSTVTLHLTVNHNTTGVDIQSACNSYTWIDGNTYTESTQTPTVTIPNAAGCDSTVTLHLTITACSSTSLTVCDSALWHGVVYTSSGVWVDGIDTLLLTVNHSSSSTDLLVACDSLSWIDGNTYTASTQSPAFTLVNAQGCDSTVTLHLVINHGSATEMADSFCVGTQYFFAGEQLTTGGVYYDTLSNSAGCDSTIRLELTMLNHPAVAITTRGNCDDGSYLIAATTDAAYHRWDCLEMSWNADWGPQEGSSLVVVPHVPLTFTLFVDYHDYPTCPNTTSVTVSPIAKPLARMEVSPTVLTPDNGTLIAISHSRDYTSLQWIVDGEDFGGDNSITYNPDLSNDSLVLMLVAANGNCSDTTSRTIMMINNTLFAPNVFTPDEATNKTFSIAFDGIVECEMTIYNRMGLQVYSTTDNTPWDGTSKGKPCPQGSYVWVAKYRTAADPQYWHTAKGTVTLLR